MACATLALAAPARGAEVGALARRVGKYAAEFVDSETGKYPCVCQGGGPDHGKAGFAHHAILTYGSYQKVATLCAVYSFRADGQSIANENCLQFVSLAK